MRIARVLPRSTVRPRVALERDGALYDVAALEAELGAALPSWGEASDFATRVVALGGAGLAELDARLAKGERPRSARLPERDVFELAPCDTDRASVVFVAAQPGARLGNARDMAGPDALVALAGERPELGVWLAVVVGEELVRATAREARGAVLGYALLLDWFDAGEAARAERGEAASPRGLSLTMGPRLVAERAAGRPGSARGTVSAGGETHTLGSLEDAGLGVADALAHASELLTLREGDVVAVGPLGTSRRLGLSLAHHAPVDVSLDRLGTLRATPVPRTPRA